MYNIILLLNFPHIYLDGLNLIKPHQTPHIRTRSVSHYHCSIIPCLPLHVEPSDLFICHILLSNLHTKRVFTHAIFSVKSQHKACSFSLWNHMNYTFSFQRVSLTKCWHLTAKTGDFDPWRRQVDQFGVYTARPRLGTWSIITPPVKGKKLLILKFMPCTPAGQVNIFREYCPIFANHTTRRPKRYKRKKNKLRGATRKLVSR